MSGLLSGLGLGDLENMDIFADPSKKQEEKEAVQKPTVQEKDFLFEKAFVCPVCDAKFVNKIMRTGKAKLLGTDKDLRPVHEGIDTQKYDVLLCPQCGYAALSRFFTQVTSTQAKFIKEQISGKVQLHEAKGETYSYEDAIERYKLALANAVVKRAKNSEKAYICLKSAWIFRGYAKQLEEENPQANADKIREAHEMEEDYLQNAYKGFKEANQTESFPMCGMDELTIDYLLAVLALRYKEYDTASKLVAAILTSSTATPRIKDKARDLKEDILAEKKK
ncbi:MAG: DUF2225 domain-containing protein [Acetatifactor sp.]|nr:DUF2225 domain-containing protein [Acetatifactor sp.]MDE7113163.1 DUF2225 domain-containing protein [Acetatifactor sp.]